jgi:hypothetical protein
MKHKTRELLVTTKVAQHWHDDFEHKVDELMALISKIDNEQGVEEASETMDVYHNSTRRSKAASRKKLVQHDKPFAFLVFRN